MKTLWVSFMTMSLLAVGAACLVDQVAKPGNVARAQASASAAYQAEVDQAKHLKSIAAELKLIRQILDKAL